MALQTSGPISILDMRNAFGGGSAFSLGQYYAGGGIVPANTPGIPTSGPISIGLFYGQDNGYQATGPRIWTEDLGQNHGGIGEGFYRTTGSWTALKNGTVRVNYFIQGAGYGYNTFTEFVTGGGNEGQDLIGVPGTEVYVYGGTKVWDLQLRHERGGNLLGFLGRSERSGSSFSDPSEVRLTVTNYDINVLVGDVITGSSYLWGAFNNDHIEFGNLYING